MANEFSMYDNVYNALRRRFPTGQGWEINERPNYGSYIPDFTIERRAGKTIERAVGEVKDTNRVAKVHIDQLNRYVRNIAGGNVKIVAKFIVVPSGCDCSIVGEDIEIIYLRGWYIYIIYINVCKYKKVLK